MCLPLCLDLFWRILKISFSEDFFSERIHVQPYKLSSDSTFLIYSILFASWDSGVCVCCLTAIHNENRNRLWHVVDWLINWWDTPRVIVQTHSNQGFCQLPALPHHSHVVWMRLKRTNPVFFLQSVLWYTGTWTALWEGKLNLWPNELGQFCRRYHVFRDF